MRSSAWIFFFFALVILLASACNLPASRGESTSQPGMPTNTPAQSNIAPTPIPTSMDPAPSQPTETAISTQYPASEPQLIAYVKDGNLLVTDVTNGEQGSTLQYPVEGQVMDLVWSPDGQHLAIVTVSNNLQRLYALSIRDKHEPVDLGPGSAPAWSPDGQAIAYLSGEFPDDNIWETSIDPPSRRQLTFETNYAWGRPVFTPDGTSLIVAGSNRDNMGATGNATFNLEILKLDGNGIRIPIPGTQFSGRLPYDLHFSPDGSHLAYSAYFHLSACVSPSVYVVMKPDGNNRQDLFSPSLQANITDPNSRYHVGSTYAWSPGSDALVVFGSIIASDFTSPTPCQVVAGPQMSIISLDGQERTIIHGLFSHITIDRTGTMIAASHGDQLAMQNNPSSIDIYSSRTGQSILTLGAGDLPEFQP